MGLKQLGFFGAFLILVTLLLLNVNFTSAQACYVTSESNCLGNSDYIAARLSGTTNAHTALETQSNFPGNNVLCCDFGGGGTTCDGSNKFLGISSSSNAHVEAPDLISPNYGTDACYTGFEAARETTSNCAGNEVEVIFLSGTTNAHTESSGTNYNSKICTTYEFSLADCELTGASWEVTEISEGSNVDMNIEGDIERCMGREISFNVSRNGVSCSDISGCTNPSNVVFGPNGTVTGTWTAGPAHSENYTFVATIVGNPSETQGSSNEIRVLEGQPQFCEDEPVVICEDYDTQSECGADQCGVAENSVPESVDCSDPNTECDCEWNSQESICEAAWEGTSDGGGTSVGKCTYEQSITSQCDEEPVGQLSFSWNATWTWGSAGEQPVNGECEEDYVLWEEDGLCYYDPNGQSAQCSDGSRVVECPAQIPLPFFNTFSFLITILLIAAIYMILNSRKSGRKK